MKDVLRFGLSHYCNSMHCIHCNNYEIISSEGDRLAFVDPFILWSNEFTFIGDQDKREKV